MRTIIDNPDLFGKATPRYHFRGDRVFYDFHTKGAKKNLKITLTINSVEYKITSDVGLLRMDVTDIINKAGFGEITINFRADVEGRPVYFGDKIIGARGKTLLGRTHGATRRIYVSDNANYVDIFVLGPCTIKTPTGNYTPREAGVVKVENARRENWQIQILYNEKQIIGALGDVIGTDEFNINVSRFCVPEGWLVVTYYDADGCRRSVPARIINTDTEVEVAEFATVTDEILSKVRGIIRGGKQQIRVGIPNVSREQYFEDILISEDVDLSDEGQLMHTPAIVATKQLSKSTNAEDILLTLKLLNL